MVLKSGTMGWRQVTNCCLKIYQLIATFWKLKLLITQFCFIVANDYNTLTLLGNIEVLSVDELKGDVIANVFKLLNNLLKFADVLFG